VLRPYLSVGSSFLVDGDAREAATLYEDNVRAQRKSMDVGAGLAWRLSKRVELFGEYRFLRMNPDPSEAASGVLHRDVDGPFLKGGFSIRLP
jgi:opacity protein-like surface antigen